MLNPTLIHVDIIIPVHNAASTIHETVRSALNQEIPHRHTHELKDVIIDIAVCCHDDGSTDDSFNILQEMKRSLEEKKCDERKTVRLKLLISQNTDENSVGAGAARNRAVSLRENNESIIEDNHFLCLLDSDDIMHKHRVAEQVSFMLTLPKHEMHQTLFLLFTY